MNTFISELNAAVRYGAAEAKALSYGTPTTRAAGALVHQAALGDDIALGLLSDMLQEHDHPATPILHKVRDGQAVEGNWYAQHMLGLMHASTGDDGNHPTDFFVLPSKETPETGTGSVGYFHLPDGHFMRVLLSSGVKKSGDSPTRRSWLVPVTEDEVKEFASGIGKLQGDHPLYSGSEKHFQQTLANKPPEERADFYPDDLRDAGLGHLVPTEAAAHYAAELSDVLHYVNWDRPTDVYPQLLEEPLNAHLHAIYADWLQDREVTPQDHQLAERIRREAHKSLLIDRPLKPAKLGDDHSLHDFVLHAVRTGHPNPTVRAMAGEMGDGPHPELINLLLHSDAEKKPHDHDVAIWLAPDDPVGSHAAHSTLKRLNSRANEEAGLEAKVVRGTMYLLDHEQPDHRAYGAPAIVFTAPVNDHSEVAALEAHATGLRNDRTAAGPGTHIGPATFSS